jgi:hypothetical protein
MDYDELDDEVKVELRKAAMDKEISAWEDLEIGCRVVLRATPRGMHTSWSEYHDVQPGHVGTLTKMFTHDPHGAIAKVRWEGIEELDRLNALWLDLYYFVECAQCSAPVYDRDYLCAPCRRTQ